MKRSTTKNALLMSALSLFLCFAMLTGTTFAWFTDTVESGVNQIVAGNLDVELYNGLDKTADKVTTSTKLFKLNDNHLWEPGAVVYENLTVANEGNLALKYQLSVNIVNATGSKSLADVLKVAVVENGITTTDRNELIESIPDEDWQDFVTFIEDGKLYPETGKDTATYGIVIWWEPSDEDNNYNMNNGEAALTIDIGVRLFATQLNSESDSFNPDYDVDAPLIPEWSGEAGELPDEENGVISISTAEELAALANAVNGTAVTTFSTTSTANSFAGKTIKLTADIDLANMPWTPIGACNSPAYFQGTFDGQGFTIYGLNVDNSTDEYMYSTAGLFGWIDAGTATIKNLNIDGATVKGSHWVGAIAGYMTGEIINCNVTNSTIIGYNVNDDANGDKIGGIVGYMNTGAGKLEGNTVSKSTVIGYRDVAGVAGAVATTNSVKNNKVDNVVISAEADYVGEIVSAKTAVVVDDTNTATAVSVVKGKTVAEGVIELATKSYAITSKEGLLNVNEIIQNTTTGEGNSLKVKLLADIDLAGETWEPINQMWIEFDGNGHTISNLKANAWKAGLFGYLGGGYIKNLTLENVDLVGAQAGAFAGATEGTIDNCVLKGYNKITYAEKHQNDDPNASLETWGGIGAISGVTQPMVVNAIIAEGTTVEINYGAIVTDAPYVDALTGYIGTNKGTVVNNGTIITSREASNNDELDKAIKNGATNIVLGSGEYIIPDSASNKTLTIVGNGDTIIANQNDGSYEGCDYSLDGATVVFENVTINTDGHTYAGYARCNATYNNCIINGSYTLYGESEFNNCTFNVEGDYYNIWTWGGKTVKFNGCTFNTDGKSILVYNQSCDVYVNDCVFNDRTNGTGFTKSALETGVDGVGPKYNIYINNTTFNGFAENDKCVGYKNIVGNKNSLTAEYLNVVIDGVDVH